MSSTKRYWVLSLALLHVCFLQSYAACWSIHDGEQIKPESDLMTKPIKYIVDTYYEPQFYFGVANHADLIGKQSGNIADREFSYITPSNDYKQEMVYPLPNGKWKWERGDKYLRHAKAHNQLIRMHGPISPQSSAWVKADERTPAELESMLKTYMTALCKRYGHESTIRWMDVVNETISPYHIPIGGDSGNYSCGDWFGPRLGVDTWENPWPTIGFDEDSELRVPKYIEMAFAIANQYTSPDKKLVINQHGQFEAVVWEKMKKLVVYLRAKGYRVDALGWQAHIDTGWEKQGGNLARLDAMIKWCHQNNLEFHVTEMNVWMKTEVNEVAQADTYEAVLQTLLNNRDQGVVGLNLWNVCDADIPHSEWLGTLWRTDGTCRLSYDRIKSVLIKNIK